jgi:hypothetical protein
MEKEEWKYFRKTLDKKDRKIFDDMFDISILYNSASSYSAKYVRIHPVICSRFVPWLSLLQFYLSMFYGLVVDD